MSTQPEYNARLLNAVLISPTTTRAAAYSMLAQLATLPPSDHGWTAYISGIFAPASEPTKA